MTLSKPIFCAQNKDDCASLTRFTQRIPDEECSKHECKCHEHHFLFKAAVQNIYFLKTNSQVASHAAGIEGYIKHIKLHQITMRAGKIILLMSNFFVDLLPPRGHLTNFNCTKCK